MRLFALVLLAAPAAAQQEVPVSVRAPAAAACTLRGANGAAAAGRLAASEPGRWSWRRLAGDVLSCAAPGFEPLDVDAGRAALPAELALEMLPSRPVTLEAAGGGMEAAMVEWRAFVAGAPHTALVARQSHALKSRLTLPVATQARVLRLRPPGSSPISLFVPEGSAPITLRVPAAAPGGEVFGLLPAHAFLPVALELGAGAATSTAEPDAWRTFRAGGLRPGSFTLVPRYRGGVRGRAHSVAVQAGQTLELLPLDLPAPGALTLALGPELCSRDTLPARLSLSLMGERGATTVLEQIVREPPCDRELEGLAEGAYEAALVRPAERPEVLGAARGHVFPGERLTLPLAAPEVRVSGRLSFGEDRPAAGLSLIFELDEQSWTAVADDNGEYSLSLGEAGEYGIRVRTAGGLPSASFSRRFEAGAQRADLKLAETVVTVRVTRFDGAPLAEEVELAVTSKAGRRLSASWSPGSEAELVFPGLDLGEYWVTGATASGLASRSAERLDLTAEQPVAEVEVVLDRHEGQLRVTDEAGALVPAEVLAGERPLAPQANGSFRLAGIAMGERLRILAPGHVPVCRRLQPEDLPEMRVVLPWPTERLTLIFGTDTPWGSGLLQGLPGSDCPIEITELEFAEQAGRDRTTVVLRVPRGRFQFTMGPNSYPVATGREAYIQ